MIVIDNCAVATADDAGTEYSRGHVLVEGNRIVAVGEGRAPAQSGEVTRVDGSGCLATPGLVNTHHHLYQWITRGLATDSTLFEWLTELYPVWARIDAESVGVAARAGLGWLALSGCTTSTDHHYVFPDDAGDLLAAEIGAAREIGIRFHPTRGSMDRGRSAGGLPPDEVVEDIDTILAATSEAITAFHDPSPDAMVRIGIAPCSPFSVSTELLSQARELATERGVMLHTHLAETVDEEDFCQATHGCTPVEYLDSLGWLGEDVWLAHCVHLSDGAIKRLGATRTGVAHCPSSNARLGAGIAPVPDLLDAGVPVGLGVDGAASQEAGMLVEELRQALYLARLRGGPAALRARQALRAATIGGARCLGRGGEIGSLEAGKLADIALWRLDGLGHADISDPVAALALGPPAPLELLTVNGNAVVSGGELRTADQDRLARAARTAHRGLIASAGRAPSENGRTS
ncbi:8-oxoguanine deaminase [Haloechinothrix sp. YIM 98757]|uniref:8-oxoguanine deaminase n=1 Tax=Haloechinothrix aidingensis TaxID=2752311 RepID=A0A838AD48_9PSEU|nr:8-oxoguanine deaminase [Haloechinothrix aidingensis]